MAGLAVGAKLAPVRLVLFVTGETVMAGFLEFLLRQVASGAQGLLMPAKQREVGEAMIKCQNLKIDQ